MKRFHVGLDPKSVQAAGIADKSPQLAHGGTAYHLIEDFDTLAEAEVFAQTWRKQFPKVPSGHVKVLDLKIVLD